MLKDIPDYVIGLQIYWGDAMKWKAFSEKISDFGCGKERLLNVVTVPYNSCDLFSKIIFTYVENNKRILYITEENKYKIAMIKFIKENTDFRKYSYFDFNSDSKDLSASIVFTNYDVASKLDSYFDLLIYDDISCYSSYSKTQILTLMNRYISEDNKLIAFSPDEIFSTKEKIYIPYYRDNNPLIEPRVILTRINTEKEICFSEYEYLKWSMEMNRNVVLFTTDTSSKEYIYNYLRSIKNKLTSNIYYFSKDNRGFLEFPNVRKKIIVTENIDILSYDIYPMDILVHNCAGIIYDTKKLLFFCGKVSSIDKERNSEVVFLVNRNTDAIEQTKEITRNFNKDAWNLGLLQY